jgi:hypothetical protein
MTTQSLPPGFSGRISDRAARDTDPGDIAAANTFTAVVWIEDDDEQRDIAWLRCSSCKQGLLALVFYNQSDQYQMPEYTGDQFGEAIRRHAFQRHRDDFPTIRAMLGV